MILLKQLSLIVKYLSDRSERLQISRGSEDLVQRCCKSDAALRQELFNDIFVWRISRWKLVPSFAHEYIDQADTYLESDSSTLAYSTPSQAHYCRIQAGKLWSK